MIFTAEQCPDENELLDLASGRRASPVVAAHVASCPTCLIVLSDAFEFVDPELEPGATLGRYRIVKQLGRGGMGTVYEARDELLDRTVAVKLLRRSSSEGRARFLREARLIAKLDHRNLVAIYDAGESDGRLYFAMELVDGASLRERMATGASPRELLRVLRDAGRGLAAAHRAGITHRDFKPANLLVGSNGRAVVADFGLAATDDERTREVAGTPAYMAPEQLAGEVADARSDQFSYCATLVHALTGALPFGGKTLADRLAAIERRELDATALAKLPRRVRRVVERGLDADPARRFTSMEALLAALDPPRLAIAGVIAGVAAVVVGGAVAGGYFARSDAPVDPCARAVDRANELWTTRGAVDPAIAHAIDLWIAQWRVARAESCRAAQPGVDTRRDREALCLDAFLVELGATIDVLSAPDADIAAMAAHAITALPAIERCRGTKPPLTSDTREVRVDRLRHRLAMLAAIGRRGGLRLTVLAGTAEGGNRLYALTLPDGRVTPIAPVAYRGDLWELPANGARAFAFDRKQDTLVTLDRTTGATVATVRVAGDIHHNGRGLAVAPDGVLVGLFQGRTFERIDPVTGALARLSTLAAEWQLETMTYCPDGALYAAGSNKAGNAVGRTLLRVDRATGAVTPLGPIGPDAIDIDTLTCAADGTLYGLDTINVETNDLYAIDPRTGARTLVAIIPGPVNGLLVE